MSDQEPLTTEELTRRARELSRLGNSSQQIRLILSRLNVTADQVEAAMAAIEAKSRQQRKVDSTFIWVLGGVAGLFFVALVSVVFLFAGRSTPAATALATNGLGPVTPNRGPTSTIPIQALAQTLVPNVPIQILPSLIPSDIPANFMLATPVVVAKPTQASAATHSACPTVDTEAAQLFGGETSDWTYDRQNNGWTMTSVAKTVTINVPQGFSAGYLVLVNGPEMRTVNGPATLDGINFVAISCP